MNRREFIKVRVYQSSKFSGFAPGKKDGVDNDGNVVLRFSGENGFTIDELEKSIVKFYYCPICGSEIEAKIDLVGPIPGERLVGVISDKVSVFHVERTSVEPLLRWRCKSERISECFNSGWYVNGEWAYGGWINSYPPLKRINWEKRL